MLYIVNAVIIQKMFHKNRTLAGGITLLGSSLGNMAGPVIVETIIGHYGWRGALLLISALLSHMIPVSLMLPTYEVEQRFLKDQTGQRNVSSTASRRMNISVIVMDICNFKLLRLPSFILFCCSFMILMFGTNTMYDHVIGRAIVFGVSQKNSAYLVSSIGIGITFSRTICSFVANRQCSNCLVIFTIGGFLGAFTSFALTFMTEFYGMVIVTFLHGVHLGE